MPWAKSKSTIKAIENAIHTPDDPPIGGQYSFGKRRTIMSTECTCSMDFISNARQQDFSFAFESDFFPAGNCECDNVLRTIDEHLAIFQLGFLENSDRLE
jgi:hypothetical protein